MRRGKAARGTRGPASHGMRLRMGTEVELRLRVHCAFSGEDYGAFAARVLGPWLRERGKGRESIPAERDEGPAARPEPQVDRRGPDVPCPD